MQLTLTLVGKNIRLPISYHQIQQGLIYRTMEEDLIFSSFIHDNGYIAENRKYKLFTFGPLIGSYEINGKEIIFRDTIRWEIRSVDARLIQLLLRRFQPGKNLPLGDNIVTIKDCILVDRQLFTNECAIRTLSPITVYITKESHMLPFSPEDPLFARAVEANARRKWKSWIKDKAPPDFSFSICQDAPYTKVVTSFKGIRVTGYSGLFTLKGEQAILNFLYNVGLGAKSAQGFGMFEIADIMD